MSEKAIGERPTVNTQMVTKDHHHSHQKQYLYDLLNPICKEGQDSLLGILSQMLWDYLIPHQNNEALVLYACTCKG